MTKDRQAISSITERVNLGFRLAERGRTEFEDIAWRRGDLIVYQVAQGKNSYVATISPNDLFDCNGNRFYDD